MNKIRILFLIDTLTGGGAEKVLQTLVNSLNPERFEITVQTVAYTDPAPYLKPHIRYRAINRRNSRMFSLWLRLCAQMGWAYPLYIRGDYDVEVAFLECGPTKLLARSINRAALKIAWVHCDLEKKPLPKGYWKHYRAFDRVVCVSETVRAGFEKLAGRPAEVLENVIDAEEIVEKSREFAVEPRKFTFGAVGRLSREKGFDRLLAAAKQLRAEGFVFRLQLIGEGPERRDLERMGGGDFLGFQENPYPYMARADVILIPSRTEGCSTVASEGLVLGRPILATDCPGMGDLLGNGGLLVENSTRGIYGGMKHLLTDRALRVSLAAAASRRGQRYDREEAAGNVEKYILKGLEEKRGEPWKFT